MIRSEKAEKAPLLRFAATPPLSSCVSIFARYHATFAASCAFARRIVRDAARSSASRVSAGKGHAPADAAYA